MYQVADSAVDVQRYFDYLQPVLKNTTYRAEDFMYMYSVENVHAFKHVQHRSYLFVDALGNCYRQQQGLLVVVGRDEALNRLPR